MNEPRSTHVSETTNTYCAEMWYFGVATHVRVDRWNAYHSKKNGQHRWVAVRIPACPPPIEFLTRSPRNRNDITALGSKAKISSASSS